MTVNEEFFRGHFPGSPLMPGVLMIEALTRSRRCSCSSSRYRRLPTRVWLRGVDNAKFRRQVVPGDRLRLEVSLGRARTGLAKARAVAYAADQTVAEAELLLAVEHGAVYIDPTARIRLPDSERERQSVLTARLAPRSS